MIKVSSLVKMDESSLSRVVHHMANHDCGIITAFRSTNGCNVEGDMPYTLEDNKKRNNQLRARLDVLGYGITTVDGVYIENFGKPNAITVKEDVYFVVDLADTGTLEKYLIKLGGEYMQDSVLFIPKGGLESILIGTNHCDGYVAYGERKPYASRSFGKPGQFMTKVRNRPFVFENTFLQKNGAGYNRFKRAGFFGKWPTSTVADRDWCDEKTKSTGWRDIESM